MRRFTPILSLLLIAGLLALAGCGGGGSSSSSTTSAPASTAGGSTSSGSGSTSSGSPVAVDMKDIAFAPASVTVKVGQKVTWTNDDSVEHNVTSTSGEKIASQNFGNGGTFSFTPTKAGTIDYVCTIHPGMDGKIIVTQ
jgi:plastocyanin